MRKIIALAMSLLAILPFLLSNTAHASEQFAISGSSERSFAGEIVTVELVLTHNPGIMALNLYYSYNTEYLTLVSVENKVSDFTMSHDRTTVWDAVGDYKEDGILATLTFAIAEDTPVGEYPVMLYFLSGANADFEEVNAITYPGTITVETAQTESLTISGNHVQSAAGKIAIVDIAITNNPGIMALNLYYSYNSEYLTLLSVENKVSDFTMSHDRTTVWDALGDYSGNGTLAVLTFAVAEDTPAGDYPVSIHFLSGANAAFEEVYGVTDPGFITVVAEQTGVQISGAVISRGEETDAVNLELYSGDQLIRSVTTSGTNGTYCFTKASAGEYLLRASKANHVTREYSITVGTTDVSQDVLLRLLGDVNGDGRISVGDTARLYAHIRGVDTFNDDYVLRCANVNGDKYVNIGDTARLYSYIRGTNPL